MADNAIDVGCPYDREDHAADGGKYVATAALEQARREQEETDDDEPGSGLDYGISLWHLRMLTENTFNGGGGYTPQEVGAMTPDQIWFRLANLETIKGKTTKTELVSPDMLADGKARVRREDGTVIEMRSTGKSKLQMIQEQALEEQRIEAEKAERRKEKRRRRREKRRGARTG